MKKDAIHFCTCYAAFLDGNPVAFLAVRHMKFKLDYFMASRVVVLPDYQGIGIGRRFLTLLAEYYRSQTHRPFYIITSNPQFVHGKMPGWRVIRVGRSGRLDSARFRQRFGSAYTSSSRSRLTVTIEYLGVPKS